MRNSLVFHKTYIITMFEADYLTNVWHTYKKATFFTKIAWKRGLLVM